MSKTATRSSDARQRGARSLAKQRKLPELSADPNSELTISGLQAQLEANALTSRQLVEMYLARISAYDQQGPALNAVAATAADALQDARELDRERHTQGARGALHGIPVIVKDNYETIGMPTTAGSRTLAGWIAPADSCLVARLRKAGAIILAKAHMHEYAYGHTNVGSLFGQTRNPYALDRSPGGSSGGTAAAVAANFAVVGLGSDTSGSIRVPASHNSLVGLRGTQGLLSRSGIIPLSHTQDIGGPLARSVADVAIVLDAIAGYDEDDPQTARSVGNIPGSYAASLQPGGLNGARIGLVRELLGSDPEDMEVAKTIRRCMTEMSREGAAVSTIDIPYLGDLLADPYEGSVVLLQEFKFDIDAYFASRPTAPMRNLAQVIDTGWVHPAVEPLLHISQGVESLDNQLYLQHFAKRSALEDALLQAMARHRLDALAYPTVRRKAAPLGEPQAGVNSQVSAISGFPAITVPAGFTRDGLPVGVELLGRPWSESTLLNLAHAYEQATRHRKPPGSTPAKTPSA